MATATMALIGLTAAMHYRLGNWHQPDFAPVVAGISIPSGLGPILLAAHIIKVLLLPASVDLWRRHQRSAAVLAVLLFIALAMLSVGSTLGALSIQRYDRVSEGAAASQRDVDRRAELATLAEWLKTIGWRRAVAEIEADLAAEQHSELWQATTSCTSPSTRAQRGYCARIERLKGELEPAREAEEARRRQAEIRAALPEQMPTSEVRHPDVMFMAQALGVAVDSVIFWRTLLIALTLEALEALPLWFLSLLAPTTRATPSDRLSSPLRRLMSWRGARRGPLGAPVIAVASKDSAMGRGEGRVRQRRMSSARGHQALRTQILPVTPIEERRTAAVHAFVAQLVLDASARETGSALFDAYDRRREASGWPPIAPNAFGALLRPAIEAVGGQKRKSNQQYYVGVRVLPSW